MAFLLRLTHAVGILTLFLMLWSGLLIYWAHDPYEITVFGYTLFHFFPDGFYKALNVPYKLGLGMGWHFTVQWFYIGNGLLYTAWLFISGHWRDVVPTRLHEFIDAAKVAGHDFGLVKTLPPQGRYNAAQKISYAGIPVLGMVATLSGWAMYKPVQLGWVLHLFGTYEIARGVHFITALLFVGFIVVHVVQVLVQAVKSGWAHLGAMFIGTPDPEEGHTGPISPPIILPPDMLPAMPDGGLPPVEPGPAR